MYTTCILSITLQPQSIKREVAERAAHELSAARVAAEEARFDAARKLQEVGRAVGGLGG